MDRGNPVLRTQIWSFTDVAWGTELGATKTGNDANSNCARRDVTNDGMDGNSACGQRIVRSPKKRATKRRVDNRMVYKFRDKTWCIKIATRERQVESTREVSKILIEDTVSHEALRSA